MSWLNLPKERGGDDFGNRPELLTMLSWIKDFSLETFIFGKWGKRFLFGNVTNAAGDWFFFRIVILSATPVSVFLGETRRKPFILFFNLNILVDFGCLGFSCGFPASGFGCNRDRNLDLAVDTFLCVSGTAFVSNSWFGRDVIVSA